MPSQYCIGCRSVMMFYGVVQDAYFFLVSLRGRRGLQWKIAVSSFSQRFFDLKVASEIESQSCNWGSKESYLESNTWPPKVIQSDTFSKAAKNPKISSMSDCLLDSDDVSRIPMVSAVLIKPATLCAFNAFWKKKREIIHILLSLFFS